jgi:hypothetical protein
MDFQDAASRLQVAGVTNEDMGRALGVAESTVRAYRLQPDTPNHRRPPEDWRPKLARLARGRGAELADLAGELEG